MTDPLVSIVTPSYNQAGFIEDTLQSVNTQSYPNVEHLVMDGGSTDGTVDILQRYEAEYDLEWVSEPDGGQSDAINKGFGRTDGDIVAWLNSDDAYFDTGVLARVSEYFQRYDADIIYGDLAYIDEVSTVTAVDVRPAFDATKLPYRILIGQPATFFRRQVVEEEQLDTSLEYSMDYEYWLRLAERFEFRHVTDVLAGFRTHDEQKSEDPDAMGRYEEEHILVDYPPERGGASVIVDNLATELTRNIRALSVTYDLHRNPPELAFDGELAPLPTMLRNLGPGMEDVRKAWRRWRTGGTSG